MKKEKSIVTQTVIRVSAVFIAAIILLAIIFIGFISNYMKGNILGSKEEQLQTIAGTTESIVDSMTEPIISLASYNSTVRLLSNYNELYTIQWMQNIRNLNLFLTNVSLFNDYIVDMILIRTDATVAYSMNDLLKRNFDYVSQEWFQRALEGNNIVKYAPPHGTDHLYNKSRGYTFSVIYPVYHADNLVGYIMLECDLSKIADFFMERHEAYSGFLLLDENGDVIFDYVNERTRLDIDYELFDSINPGTSIDFYENNSLYIARKLSSTNWIMVSENDYNYILRPVKQLLLMTIAIILIVVVMLILISIYNGKVIEKPFNALIARIVSYEGSKATAIEELKDAPKELAIIHTKFEEMADKMNSLINDVYLAKLSQKEMELVALTNQINPHFIYNVFQLIQAKAVLTDNQEIEEIIQALSNMMRYAMERRREKVEIKEEIEYIDNYLMFYKARFPQLFTYKVNCEPELLKCLTLKFILQPVVENCFKHAFKDIKAGGIIDIKIRKTEKEVVFTVWDNGHGMDEEKLEFLRERLNYNIEEAGIGIVNTNARIRLAYGYPYCLSVSSQKGKFTQVTIQIKYENT